MALRVIYSTENCSPVIDRLLMFDTFVFLDHTKDREIIIETLVTVTLKNAEKR